MSGLEPMTTARRCPSELYTNTSICALLEIGRGNLTVGKIYGGVLIMDNWKQTRFGQEFKPAFQVYSTYI